MEVDIVTREDLHHFRGQLLEDIKSLIKPVSKHSAWLSSAEVRRMLKISPSTLQTLRVKENIQISKLLGRYYYNADDIERIFQKNASGK